uniref:Reverse transcriptase RNase H-like domain-containing protein n=1 Tax=Monopterus albus TaxID=43700 RepID=A0A3Q3K903_MONAL
PLSSRKVNLGRFITSHKLSVAGVQPDPQMLKAIVQTPQPKTNYMEQFIPNLSANTKALHGLLGMDAAWQWEHEHTNEWEAPKSSLICQDGLEAILLQQHDGDWFPVAFKSMKATESSYAQIEKEALGVVFGCEKFHEYIYGREVEVETDHKSLINKTAERCFTTHPASAVAPPEV